MPPQNAATKEVNISDIFEFMVFLLPIDIYNVGFEIFFFLRIVLSLTVSYIHQLSTNSVTIHKVKYVLGKYASCKTVSKE